MGVMSSRGARPMGTAGARGKSRREREMDKGTERDREVRAFERSGVVRGAERAGELEGSGGRAVVGGAASPMTHMRGRGRISIPPLGICTRVCAADKARPDSVPQRRLRGGRTVAPRISKLSNVSARKRFPGHRHRRVDGGVSRRDGDKVGKVWMAATPMVPISAKF